MTEEVAQQFVQTATAKIAASLASIGEWNGQPMERKSGKFGDYIKCGELSIPYKEEPLEETIQRLEAKATGALNTFKDYVIRSGQYGPYIMKTSVKKSAFISLPKGLDPKVITEKDVAAIYTAGVEQKKSGKKLETGKKFEKKM
jgi:topoisomerase IA-like protein